MALNKKGFTLTEMLVAMAILGIIGGMAAGYLVQVVRFQRLSQARIEIQRDARNILGLINRLLRQSKASSIQINQVSGQPPHSKIKFETADSETYEFYQSAHDLYMKAGSNNPKVLSENLRYLTFSVPRTDDFSIVSISMTFEKATYEGGTKALQLSIEKVRVMNE